jgi:hypothetical protein
MLGKHFCKNVFRSSSKQLLFIKQIIPIEAAVYGGSGFKNEQKNTRMDRNGQKHTRMDNK